MPYARRLGPDDWRTSDAIFESDARRLDEPITPFGHPQNGRSGVIRAKFGDLLVCETDGIYKNGSNTYPNDAYVHLPGGQLRDIGNRVTVVNNGVNRVVVVPPSGVKIQGKWDQYPITKGTAPVTFVFTSKDTYTQIGGPLERVWLEWNGEDLSQFQTKWDGSNVSSSAAIITTAYGLNWVDIAVTAAAGGGGGDSTLTTTLLPFRSMCPTANYRVEADVLGVTDTAGNIFGMGVAARAYGSGANLYGYAYRYYQSGGNEKQLVEFNAATSVKHSQNDISLGTPEGLHMAVEANGANLRAQYGEWYMEPDTATILTDAKYGAIFVSPHENSGQSRAYFRNIKVTLLD